MIEYLREKASEHKFLTVATVGVVGFIGLRGCVESNDPAAAMETKRIGVVCEPATVSRTIESNEGTLDVLYDIDIDYEDGLPADTPIEDGPVAQAVRRIIVRTNDPRSAEDIATGTISVEPAIYREGNVIQIPADDACKIVHLAN